jgi:hypothetical protein
MGEIVIGIIMFLAGHHYFEKLRKRINFVEKQLENTLDEINQLKYKLQRGGEGTLVPTPVIAPAPIVASVVVEEEIIPAIPTEVYTSKVEAEVTPVSIEKINEKINKYHDGEKGPLPPPANDFKEASLLWKKIEEQFAGNLIGVLGTIAVVLGVIFMAVYAVIQMGPIGRFGVICSSSAGLYVLFYLLNKKEIWKNISLWIRSASGVIFLIGCIGSIGIGPIQWIYDPLLALLFLNLGLFVNLAMGFLNGGQVFASLHVLLSFMALVLIPLEPVTFAVAAIIAAVGILISYKNKKWDEHIIVTNLGFFGLQCYWVYNEKPFPIDNIMAILFCAGVGIIGLLAHYRKVYESEKLSTLALIAHMVTWATLGINVYLYSMGSYYSSVILGMAAVSVFYLSAKAKKHATGWLYISDRLMSLLLFFLAALSLQNLGASPFEIALLIAIFSVLFLKVISNEDDLSLNELIFQISCGVSLLAYGAVCALTILNTTDLYAGIYSTGMIVVSFLILALVYPSIEKKTVDNEWGIELFSGGKKIFSSLLGIPFAFHAGLAAVLVLSSKEEFSLMTESLVIMIPVAILLCTFYLKNKFKNMIYDITAFLTSTFIFVIYGFNFIDFSGNNYSLLLLWVPLLCVSIVTLVFNKIEAINQKVVWPGIALVWGSLTIGIYIFTKDKFPMLGGVLYLMMALIAVELKNWQPKLISGTGRHERMDIFVSCSAVASIAVFLMRFAFVDIQSELWIGVFKVRVLIEVFSIFVILYWWFDSKKSSSESLSKYLDYLLETVLVTGFSYAMCEMSGQYLALLWSISAIVVLVISSQYKLMGRFSFYSFLIYLCALISIGFISSSLVTVSNLFYEKVWVLTLVSIAFCIIYLIVAIEKKWLKNSDEMDTIFSSFRSMHKMLKLNDTKFLMYPMLVAVTLFLIGSFSSTILSLLLIMECFVLFLISITLRQADFRIISMTGIALIFMRVIFYDLAGTDFFIKAIVFILIGAILIAMNTIYNRYKHRYNNEQN